MPLLVRALINGFGWKLGFEVGRYVARRIGITDDAPKRAKRKDDEEPDDGDLHGQEPPGGELS